jgi:hypothetical protein
MFFANLFEVMWIVFCLQVPQAGLNDVPCKFVVFHRAISGCTSTTKILLVYMVDFLRHLVCVDMGVFSRHVDLLTT